MRLHSLPTLAFAAATHVPVWQYRIGVELRPSPMPALFFLVFIKVWYVYLCIINNFKLFYIFLTSPVNTHTRTHVYARTHTPPPPLVYPSCTGVHVLAGDRVEGAQVLVALLNGIVSIVGFFGNAKRAGQLCKVFADARTGTAYVVLFRDVVCDAVLRDGPQTNDPNNRCGGTAICRGAVVLFGVRPWRHVRLKDVGKVVVDYDEECGLSVLLSLCQAAG